MIDEKKLIDELLAQAIYTDNSYGKGIQSGIDKAIEIINNQPKIDKWIMCSDRLPVGEEYEIYDKEEDMIMHKHVLAYTNNSNIRQCVAYYDTDCWFCAVTNYPIKVIKWMDLPREESE